jgi:hypothetical protein
VATFNTATGVIDGSISPSAFLRADTLSVADGTAVSSVADTSGGVAWTQATGTRQPLFKTNIFGTKPALRFDGVDDFLNRTAGAAFNFGTAFFLFRPLTAAVTTATGTKNPFGWESPGGGLIAGMCFGNIGGSLTNELVTIQHDAATPARSAWTQAGATFPIGTTCIISTRWDSGTSRYLIYQNGGANLQNAFTGTPAIINSTLTQSGASPNAEFGINLDVAVALVYATVLSDAQKASVHSWMQDVWGATAADYDPTWSGAGAVVASSPWPRLSDRPVKRARFS